MKNHVIHLGFPKTATSWLQRFIFNNSDIKLQAVKRHLIAENIIYPSDLEYNRDLTREIIFSEIEEIEDSGKRAIISHENLVGGIINGGYYNFNIANRLKDLFPNAKIILVIRNQADIIFSSYLQYVKSGGKCKLDRLFNPPIDGILPMFRYEYFEFHRLIKLYQDNFGKGNVLVLPYEQFVKDPKEYVIQVRDFMEIDLPKSLPFKSLENKSMRGMTIPLKRLTNRLVTHYSSEGVDAPFLVSKKASGLITGAFNKISDLLLPSKINNLILKNIKKKISDNIEGKYGLSNSKTEFLTGLDLKKYGYEVETKNHIIKSVPRNENFIVKRKIG